MNTARTISCVIPIFNEEAVLPLLIEMLSSLNVEPYAFEFICVDDGSQDNSLGILLSTRETDERFKIIQLSRNFGHQTAITAGLEAARGDCAVILDADLQDPPQLITEFIRHWENGADVVYGIRTNRKEAWFKRACYKSFYLCYGKLASFKVPLDSGDFCLIGRRALDLLNALPERVRFVRGLRSWVGLNQVGVPYERAERAAGSPKYTFLSLTKLAFDGLINFSTIPLQLATLLSFITALGGLAVMVWALAAKFLEFQVPWGWTSLMVVMLFLFSILFFIIAIMGQYIGRIFLEVKERPLYLVSQTWGLEPSSTGDHER